MRRALLLIVAGLILVTGCKKKKSAEGGAGVSNDTPAGTMLADSGFRPAKHGFPFPNKGSVGADPWLTVADLRVLFGDAAVCMPGKSGADCNPTPAAEQWLTATLRSMKGGVCEGMAVASLSLFRKIDDPTAFGAGTAFELAASPELKRLIGLYYSMQFVEPGQTETGKVRDASTPNDILDRMTEVLKTDDLTTFGFYHQSGRGGHSVVPYAVESKGKGIFWLRVYDNNAPGAERYLEFDRTKNTWKYDFGATKAGVKAAPWTGDADSHSLDYTRLSWRAERKCPFCSGSGGLRQISFHGAGHLIIKDAKGNKVGVENGKVVSDIPGARVAAVRGYLPGEPMPEPVYFVPASGGYDITIDGGGEAHTDGQSVAVFGGGMVAVIDNIKVSGDLDDHLTISADGHGISYKPSSGASPVIRIAYDGAEADYLFQVGGLDVAAGDELQLSVDPDTGKLKVFDSGGGDDTYDLRVARYTDDDDEQVYVNDDAALGAGEADYIDFEGWAGDGEAMAFETDEGNDGSMDEAATEADEVGEADLAVEEPGIGEDLPGEEASNDDQPANDDGADDQPANDDGADDQPTNDDGADDQPGNDDGANNGADDQPGNDDGANNGTDDQPSDDQPAGRADPANDDGAGDKPDDPPPADDRGADNDDNPTPTPDDDPPPDDPPPE